MASAKINIATALLVTLALLFSAATSHALLGLGSALGKAARETIEYTARKFGINLAKESGKHFARQAERFIVRYGDDGIRALKKGGPDLLSAARRHGKDAVKICAGHGDDTARYLVKHMDEALPIWRQFGREGTELMVKHPGLARTLLTQFGKKGLKIGQKLSTQMLIKFLRISRKSTKKVDLEGLVDGALKYGDKLIEFLWSHKWKLTFGATVYTLLKEYEKGLTVTEIDKSGEEKAVQFPTAIHHFLSKVVDSLLTKYPWLPLAGIGMIILWAYPLLSIIWRAPKFFRRLIDKVKTLIQKRKLRKAELMMNPKQKTIATLLLCVFLNGLPVPTQARFEGEETTMNAIQKQNCHDVLVEIKRLGQSEPYKLRPNDTFWFTFSTRKLEKLRDRYNAA